MTHVSNLSSLWSGAVATRPALCMLVAQLPPAAVLMRMRLHAVGHATRACPTSLGQVGVEPWFGSRSPATDIAVSYDLVVQRLPWVSAPNSAQRPRCRLAHVVAPVRFSQPNSVVDTWQQCLDHPACNSSTIAPPSFRCPWVVGP